MNITVYSTTTCPYCIMLKRWLDDKKISYTEHLVDRDTDAALQMIELSGQRGVPFSTIEHEDGSVDKILGFDRERFQLALNR